MSIEELIEELQKLLGAGKIKPDYELVGVDDDGNVYQIHSFTIRNESIFLQLGEPDD